MRILCFKNERYNKSLKIKKNKKFKKRNQWYNNQKIQFIMFFKR